MLRYYNTIVLLMLLFFLQLTYYWQKCNVCGCTIIFRITITTQNNKSKDTIRLKIHEWQEKEYKWQWGSVRPSFSPFFFPWKTGWKADILRSWVICKGSLFSVLEDFLFVFLILVNPKTFSWQSIKDGSGSFSVHSDSHIQGIRWISPGLIQLKNTAWTSAEMFK